MASPSSPGSGLPPSLPDGLAWDVQELRIRLAEAEEALQVIRKGEVDAIVVESPAGPQVFSLSGAETIYRVTVESMAEAALNITESGQILFCNERFAQLVRTPVHQLLGRNLHRFVDAAEGQGFRALLQACRHRPVQGRVLFVASDGTRTATHLTGQVLPGQGDAAPSLCLVATDLTELEQSLGQIAELRETQAALEQSMNALRESEERLRSLGDNLPDSAVYQYVRAGDAPGRFTHFSAGIEQLTGIAVAEALRDASALHRQILPEYRERWLREEARCLRELADFDLEVPMRRPDGEVRWMRLHSRPRRLDHGEIVWDGVQTDVTERKLAETALLRSNRALLALSRSRQAMLHATEERAFLSEICRILAADCGHEMVWVGLAEQNESKRVIPVASSGFEDGYLENLHVSWADDEWGRGPSGTAIRTRQPAACTNMRLDPQFAPWREEALRRGFAASLALPLLEGDHAFGVLSLYFRELEPLGEPEVALLRELAGDIAYGIMSLRARRAREQAEAALQASLHEKDVLLHEVHHRVKNNLQIVSSLVSLQARKVTGEERAPFENIRDQVRAMALVHEYLYRESDFGQIDFSAYARSLLDQLWRAHGHAADRAALVLDLQPVAVLLTKAVPCGLILNELAGNALKHAFPDGHPGGTVAVALRGDPEGRVSLRVADNGRGLPAGLDLAATDSLGMRLVHLLAGQLRGSVAARRPAEGGTEFELSFSNRSGTQTGAS